jgi:predicted molibdopterin-dependent oxidoreductase YjgC
MPPRITIRIDGRPVEVERGATVAAALLMAGVEAFRRSVTGEPRAPLCGMGVCFECLASIDGEQGARSCQILCRDGMEVRTGG